MTNQDTAIPVAQAPATPGHDEHNNNPPSVVPAAPVTPAPGNNNEGKVVISTEEYARLQRDSARTKSFAKRVYQRPSSSAAGVSSDDPAAAAIAEANAKVEQAEKRALQAEVRGKVRDLLADDRFSNLPKTTKDLILQSPHMLTQAETLEDAMYDIEDKLLEMAGTVTPSANSQNSNTPSNSQRETPPIVTPGNPAPVDSGVLEKTDNLRGVNRSTAIIRNAIKKQHGGVKE